MTTIGSLSRAELGARMAREGIVLQTGCFSVHLRSSVPALADGIALMYRDFPVHAADAFSDFQIEIVRPATLRRWYRPQVNMLFDGHALFQPLPLAQAFPMFEWGLNWCVANRAHRYLMIHAAVLERGGRAVILPAPPGSGKSTLCAALAHRGWRLLSDELTLVRPDDGLIVPVPRPISLKNASITVMQQYLDQPVFSPPVADTMKGTVAHLRTPTDAVTRGAECARPGWIVFPRYEAGAASTLETLERAHTHMEMAKNAFNYSLLGARGFDMLADLVSHVRSYRYTYSALDDAMAVFDELAAQP
ncbi:HprK-related kinase A [Pseudoduganella ginsengisoli]|uniref:HprK-related kinase A n=2 Tax=Pseudoduganella ginsengisoli TaxID=1462440 RepID=A0A6L6PZJ4_9BURK|nr:HprK-related kinase A [Pseudoduganella ginsengisoli]